MKNSKKLLVSSIAAAVLASTGVVSTAQAEVSASLSASNFYLWRGVDLSDDGEGGSAPAIVGDINVSGNGFYAGVWTSSGDEALGQEYDLYFGWGTEVGDFSFDINYTTYIYPSAPDGGIDAGDVEDIIISLGYGPVGFTVYENIAEESGAEDTRYVSLDYTVGDFNLLIGQHDNGDDKSEHLQVGYSYNDNLSFTVSKFLDDDMFNDEVLFNVAYSFDIK